MDKSPRQFNPETLREPAAGLLPIGTATESKFDGNLKAIADAVAEVAIGNAEKAAEMLREIDPSTMERDEVLTLWEGICNIQSGGDGVVERRNRILACLTASGGNTVSYLRSVIAAAIGAEVDSEWQGDSADGFNEGIFFAEVLPFRIGRERAGDILTGVAFGLLSESGIAHCNTREVLTLLERYRPEWFRIYHIDSDTCSVSVQVQTEMVFKAVIIKTISFTGEINDG